MEARRAAPARVGGAAAPARGDVRRRRSATVRPAAGSRKALVFSRRPPGKALAGALAEQGLDVVWTDSGPSAICEAVSGDLAACFIAVGRHGDWEVGFLPCLNRVDRGLPLVVISDRDSIGLQRRLRSHRVFYYLLEPLDPAELRAVIEAAVRGRWGRPIFPQRLDLTPHRR